MLVINDVFILKTGEARTNHGYIVQVEDHIKFNLEKYYHVYEFFKNDIVLTLKPKEKIRLKVTLLLLNQIPEKDRQKLSRKKYISAFKKSYKFLKLRNIFKSRFTVWNQSGYILFK